MRGGTEVRPALSSTNAAARDSSSLSWSSRRTTSAWLRKRRLGASLKRSSRPCPARAGPRAGPWCLAGGVVRRLGLWLDHLQQGGGGGDQVVAGRRRGLRDRPALRPPQRGAEAGNLRAQGLLDPVERDDPLVDLPEEAGAHRFHAVERALDEFRRRGGDALDQDAADVRRIRGHGPEGELDHGLEQSVEADRARG